jgi:tetratricopeptide (TPR) repeat protein
MFNVLEAFKVMARHRLALASGVAAAIFVGLATPATAQAQRVIKMDPNAKRILVVTFAGPDRKLGMEAGEFLRTRIMQDFNNKGIWSIPKEEIEGNLEPASFKYIDALSTNDARLLGQMLRADVFIQGQAVTENGMVKVTPWMIAVNDLRQRQPLPVRTGRRIDHAMREVSGDFKEAWKQWADEQRCEALVREGTSSGNKAKYQEAQAAARAAITAYPAANIARVCLMTAMQLSGATPDQILTVAKEVLATDPKNYHALIFAANAYKGKADTIAYVNHLVTVLATEPTNVVLASTVVNELAAMKKFGDARKIIDDAVAANPGDPDLIRLRFRILTATEEWKEAILAGEELMRTDTSATDTLFFINLASAYKSDSQPDAAANAIAKGIAKYPGYARLYVIQSQYLRQAGKPADAIEISRKLIELDPKSPDAALAYLTIVQSYIELGQFDSIAPTLRAAATVARTAEDSGKVSQFALQQGQRLFNAARADSAVGREDAARATFQESIGWFALADSISASDQAKFQQGMSAVLIADKIISKQYVPSQKTISKEQACTLGQAAQSASTLAQLKLSQGGRFNPQLAATLLGNASQLGMFSNQIVGVACKPAAPTAAKTPR